MVSIRSLFCLAVACLLLSTLDARAASPSCTFSAGQNQAIFAGVQLEQVTATCPPNGTSTAHVLTINLTQPSLSVVPLTAGTVGTPQTFLVSSALSSANAQVAVNASLFTGCCSYNDAGPTSLLGLAVANGVTWSAVGANLPST